MMPSEGAQEEYDPNPIKVHWVKALKPRYENVKKGEWKSFMFEYRQVKLKADTKPLLKDAILNSGGRVPLLINKKANEKT